MVNDFPEEPVPYGVGDEQYYGARMDEYNAAVSAAKASAVEVVNPTVMTPEVWYSIKDGATYEMPKGWMVEIEQGYEVHDGKRWVKADKPGDIPGTTVIVDRARLIPLKEQSSGITYMHDRECRRYKDEGTYCQEHCYFKDSGLKECHSKSQSSGIAAVGVAEYGDLGVESVSPPPQAESRWISVDNEWPLETMPVLWCHDPVEEPYIVASLLDEGFDENQYTHWMPLPEPPITRKAKP